MRRTAASVHGVFTLAEALERGWSPRALQQAVRDGRVERLRVGAYRVRPASPPVDAAQHQDREQDTVDLAVGAARCVSASAVSHSSAALIRGIDLLPHKLRAAITVPPRHVGRIPGVHLHRAGLEHDVTAVGITPVTTSARTALDIAREQGLGAGVVAVDSALHRELTTDDELHAVLRRMKGWPMSRRARAAVELADGRSESPLESLSRLAIAATDLPLPVPQQWIRNRNGVEFARVDFLWPGLRIIGECDGLEKYRSPEDLRAERLRHGILENLGFIVIRWTWADLDDFAVVIRRIRDAIRRRAGERIAPVA